MPPPARKPGPQRSELAEALSACRGTFIAVALMSGMSNILQLTGAFFMLEVYDRVLPSRSVPTLVGLVILAAFLFTALGLLDMIRGRILVRIGGRLDEALSGRVYETIVRLPLKAGNRGDSLQPLRDLDSVRSFLSGMGPAALFDLPWLPIYLFICFMFHPYIGLAALIGAIILAALTWVTERMTRDKTREATMHGSMRNSLADASRRNAEVLTAMGMTSRIAALWSDANTKYQASQRDTTDVGGGIGSISKVLRMMLQSGVLAVGAYLVIYQMATPGIIIAGSILSARALAPVDLAIANWRGFVGARQSWKRLTDLLAMLPSQMAPMALRPPVKSLAVEGVAVVPPGSEKVAIQEVSLSLQAGSGLGVIGPSGSGKSCLARVLVNVWKPVRGRIRLDGAALEQWSQESLGKHVGYLPQDVELLAGTIAQNIGRFIPQARSRHGDRGGPGGRRARTHRRPARRLRNPGRRERHFAVRRPGTAGCACARAVRRSVPGRARRTQLQPRLRRRRGAEPRHHERARPRRHRGGDRAPAERDCRRRPAADDESGPRPGIRSERRSAGARAAAT